MLGPNGQGGSINSRRGGSYPGPLQGRLHFIRTEETLGKVIGIKSTYRDSRKERPTEKVKAMNKDGAAK